MNYDFRHSFSKRLVATPTDVSNGQHNLIIVYEDVQAMDTAGRTGRVTRRSMRSPMMLNGNVPSRCWHSTKMSPTRRSPSSSPTNTSSL
jgi:hypothetical protein